MASTDRTAPDSEQLFADAWDHHSNDRWAQAEPLYRRALAIREHTLGADHLLVADSLDALANTLPGDKQQPEAQELRTRAAAIRAGEKP